MQLDYWMGIDIPLGTCSSYRTFTWRLLSGHLWWRTWGEPTVTADVYVTVAEDFDDAFYWGEILDEVIADWDSGRWVQPGATFTIEWLDEGGSAEIAERVFGVDLAWERRDRGPSVT